MTNVIVIIITLIMFNVSVNAIDSSDEFQKNVTKILIKNPNDLNTIVKAGCYFYKRKN